MLSLEFTMERMRESVLTLSKNEENERECVDSK